MLQKNVDAVYGIQYTQPQFAINGDIAPREISVYQLIWSTDFLGQSIICVCSAVCGMKQYTTYIAVTSAKR